MKLLILLLCLLTLGLQAKERPNILWFVVDDMSANFSCYGEDLIQTPHVDALARQGARFTRAYATSPVCSTFRSALITGMYQTTVGAHHQDVHLRPCHSFRPSPPGEPRWRPIRCT